jgi:hypothetical protein
MLVLTTGSFSNGEVFERHVKVAMRMIGDQLLLSSGDSTSRVLAVEKVDDKYKIEFEKDFKFHPDELINIVYQVVKETNIAVGYLVEVEDCKAGTVIYSYEFLKSTNQENIPCRKRAQPKGCYKLFFTIIETSNVDFSSINYVLPSSHSPKEDNIFFWLLVISLMGLISSLIYFWKKKLSRKVDAGILQIGSYLFDKKGMILTLKKQVVELSSKETDLLFLLFTNENKTLEREHILNVIWGDEGDYIGRTLDVYISKLRKKLENDSSLKIINIRGVGYRFVMN